jgi:selT/selW/selH-like putative selenoprotein
LQGHGIDATATTGRTGQFDVLRDGELVFSKAEHKRFPDEAEILAALAGR